MSILSFPRINFCGVFRTNPCTANNDDVMPEVVERDENTLGRDLDCKTDDEIRDYLRERVQMADYDGKVCKTFIRSGWNLYGDHFTNFDDTVITSIVVGPRPEDRFTAKNQDSLIGVTFKLLGSVTNDPARRQDPVICDLDCTGLVTTQLFIGGIQIGSGGPSGIDPGQIILQVDHDTRGFQNWLNFNSTVTVGSYGGEQNFVGIGCIMQFGMPASAIPNIKTGSAALNALLDATRAAAGVLVRFRCYEVQPGITDGELGEAYQQGNALENPAFGYLVGTIGVWEHGEPATEPAGRKLQCPYPRPKMKWRPKDGKDKCVPVAPAPWQGPPALIGNAVALVRQSPPVISLDIVGSFPKCGFRDPDGSQKPSARGFKAPREKANVGQVELAFIPEGGVAPQPITDVEYGLNDYSNYDLMGGIQDLTYDPTLYEAISKGTLVLRGKGSREDNSKVNPGVILLQEVTKRVVTDDRGVYMLPGEKDRVIRIKVSERGGPTTTDTDLYLKEYQNIIQTEKPGLCTDGYRPNQTVKVQPEDKLVFPSKVTIPAGKGYQDWYEIKISADLHGATILSYQLEDVVFGTSVPAWSTANYSSIRIYPDDDFSAIYAQGEIKWDDVYEKVLRYYYVLFPAMSGFIPLNKADSIVKNGNLIKERLHTPDNPAFYSTYNMPITRAMSPNRVKLVLDFIEQEQKKQQPPSPPATGQPVV